LASYNVFNTENSSLHTSLRFTVLYLFCQDVKIRVSISYNCDHSDQNPWNISTLAFQYSDVINTQWYNKNLHHEKKQDKQCTCKLNMRYIRKTIIAVEQQ